MNLLDILDLDLIDLDMDATDKDGVLKQLSSMLYKKEILKIWINSWKRFMKEKALEKQVLEGLRFLMV